MFARITFSNKSQVIVFSNSGARDVKKIVGALQHGAAIVIAYYRFREGWLSPLVDEAMLIDFKYDYDTNMALYTSQHYEKASSRMAFEQSTEELVFELFRKEQKGDTYAHLPAITAALMGREWKAPSDEEVRKRDTIRRIKAKKAVTVIEEIPEPGTIYYATEDAKKFVEAGKKGRTMTYHADRKCGLLNKGRATIVAIAEGYDKEGLLTKMKQCTRCKAAAEAAQEVNPIKGAQEEIKHMPEGYDKNQSTLIATHMEETTDMVKGMQGKIAKLEEHIAHKENEFDALTDNIEELMYKVGSIGNELDNERRKMKGDELIRLYEKDLIAKSKKENVRNDEIGVMYRTLLFLKSKMK